MAEEKSDQLRLNRFAGALQRAIFVAMKSARERQNHVRNKAVEPFALFALEQMSKHGQMGEDSIGFNNEEKSLRVYRSRGRRPSDGQLPRTTMQCFSR